MDIETAPSATDDEDSECDICDGENTFVIYEGDKVCKQCGHAPAGSSTTVTTADDPWGEWFDHRDERYSGWYGEDRIKFPGGFSSAYEFSSDF